MPARSWLMIVVVTLVLIGLVGFARGREHRRGDEVGERPVAMQASLY